MLKEYHIVRVRVSKAEYYSMQGNAYLGLAVYDEKDSMLRFTESHFQAAQQFNEGQEYKISGKAVGEEAKAAVTNFTAKCVEDGKGAGKALSFKVTEINVKEDGVTMK
ncbi:hypothetical protein [uncultured Phascolarctobacterium sp.]|jgi:hypothetical protein|uniref:hypothetical protein n=1 Tax=uncultured Phascolarctobacterium sp. TaxID=512296 RepID=UPI0025E3F82D|nr:hypothetical protein [uncultured Phascolarctobacterium sp.]